MSGRRAKVLRRLAAIYRDSLRQEPDPETRALLRWMFGQGLARDERRMMRRALRGWG